MNRLVYCIILLLTLLPLAGQSVLAEKLYRWIEPDGSITFSPNPPPAGTDYKAVNAAHNNAGKADLPELDQQPSTLATSETDQKPSILATSEHGLDTLEPTNNATEIMAQPAPEVERQKLTYAPDIGIKRSNTPSIETAAATQPSQAVEVNTNSVAVNKKRQQCQDLNKRVLSLERRLRSPLKAVDMDNTVVAMARYQRSYDLHCVE